MDAVEKQVRLTLGEEARAEEGQVPCVKQDRRLTALESKQNLMWGGIALMAFLGNLLGSWLSK